MDGQDTLEVEQNLLINLTWGKRERKEVGLPGFEPEPLVNGAIY